MIIECSVNFLLESQPCAATNECRANVIHQQSMHAAAVAANAPIQRQSRQQERVITRAVSIARTRRLMSLLATISNILIIAYTMSVGIAIAAAASATSSATAASMVTWPPMFFHSEHIQCPSLADIPTCPCYKFDDGLLLECPGTSAMTLRSTLQLIKSPVQTLSLYDFDRSATSLSSDMFVPGVFIRQLQFSSTQLSMLKDNSLQYLRLTLESLSITHSKLTQIPRNALSGMEKLMVLEFDSNKITSIHDYNFYGLRLAKLNLKANVLENIPEYAFAGLEESLTEIDLSENKIKLFPMLALKKLDRLRSLRLSANEIATMYKGNRSIRLPALTFLDISLNRFNEIDGDCFEMFPNVTILSLYNNGIVRLDRNAFATLSALKSLDISHNKIVRLDRHLFEMNGALQTVDFSHNHLHAIDFIFVNLPELRDVFLSDNNILDLPADAFTNSTGIVIIFLENNAIRRVDENAFSTLTNLEQLYLSWNFIAHLPQTVFDQLEKLISLGLDWNLIRDLRPNLFRANVALREIYLRHNRLRAIHDTVFQPLPALIELQLQNNSISTIAADAFATLTELQHINLQMNQLTQLTKIFPAEPTLLQSIDLDGNSISAVDNETFKGMTNVYTLRLANNHLTKLDRPMFRDVAQLERLYAFNNSIAIIQPNTFQGMEQLRYLDLSGNRLRAIKRTLFVHLKSLEELNLAANDINDVQLKAFVNLKKLMRLDLSNNPVGLLARNTFPADIAHLNLRNCSLTQINAGTFNGLNNLVELNLELNNLTWLDVRQLDATSVRILRLSHNNFVAATTHENIFEKFTVIERIEMKNCNIQHLPETLFRRNSQLVRLDVSGNAIRHFDPTIFNGLHALRELHINRNLFSELPHAAFANISSLETLSIAHNILTTLDFQKLLGLPNLRHLIADNNVISSLGGFAATMNLSRLQTIDLSGNILMELPRNFLLSTNAVVRIDLAYNRFPCVPKLVPMPSSAATVHGGSSGAGGNIRTMATMTENTLSQLNCLNLTGNPFTSIHGNCDGGATASAAAAAAISSSDIVADKRYVISSLHELYITRTNLTAITSTDFQLYPALQHLHLAENHVQRIASYAFKKLNNLLTLDISINELEHLPRECLRGLVQLRHLNLSSNLIRELDEFSIELTYLETLDISHNQLDRIERNTFQHLHGLLELRLTDNRLRTITVDSFRFLNNLVALDVRGNSFKEIPLDVFNLLETHLRTLHTEYNPYNCSCETQSLWNWVRNHQKILQSSERFIQCEYPAVLRGRPFSQVTAEEFCPLITRVSVDDIQPYSVSVSWENREHSGLSGFEIFYRAMDGGIDDVQLLPLHLNNFDHTAKLNVLSSSTHYRICVIGLGNRLSSAMAIYASNADEGIASARIDETAIEDIRTNGNSESSNELFDYDDGVYQNVSEAVFWNFRNSLMKSNIETPISKCIEVRTLATEPIVISDQNRLTDRGFIHSLLTRRLGLIVGCCLGILVFIIIITVLGWLKLKKRRIENAKRQEQHLQQQHQLNYQHRNHPDLSHQTHIQPPPDYNTSYRQFAIPYDDVNYDGGAGFRQPSPPSNVHPNCISGTVIGTTTLNC